jgi:hypothetical protein
MVARDPVVDRIVDSERPEIALHCEGYYGFGAGWATVKHPEHAEGLYCNACPFGKACWGAHKERVRAILPEMMDAYDKVVEEAMRDGVDGPAIVSRVKAAFDGLDPLLAVMGGNIEDGVRVANHMPPKYRGELSLVWPWRTH